MSLTDVVGFAILLGLLILSVGNTVYVRRTNREQLALIREQQSLTRRMSEAINWLVDDAKKDIRTGTAETKQTVEKVGQEIKQEIQQSVRPADGSGP